MSKNIVLSKSLVGIKVAGALLAKALVLDAGVVGSRKLRATRDNLRPGLLSVSSHTGSCGSFGSDC